MSQNIGPNQIGCLRALRDSGVFPGRWHWENASTTVRILDSLVRRGQAETYEVPNRYLPGQTITHYRITDTGRAALTTALAVKR